MNDFTSKASGAKLEGVIRINEQEIESHVGEVVRQSVEETLNGLLEAEAEQLCGAKRYQRSEDRSDTRAGPHIPTSLLAMRDQLH